MIPANIFKLWLMGSKISWSLFCKEKQIDGDQLRVILWRKKGFEYVGRVEEPYIPYYRSHDTYEDYIERSDFEWLPATVLSTAAIAAKLEMSTSGIERNLRILKKEGRLKRVDPDKGGYWEALEHPSDTE